MAMHQLPSSQSGSSTRPRLWWMVFLFPGKAILWFQYHFPKFGNVIATGRRYRSRTCGIMYSAVFWVLVVAWLLALLHGALR
ncbi:hypothetical protein GGD54_006011 [Rhizobium tropici]|uniref:Uncharacterized protein n=2 Tax=Rhizobium TaxID=379 RepID=A0A1C3XGY1_9HYPH|nr:hypothetical protein [Rhizobium tropici]MBB5596513.1 hypothetical protein [Rhizobium tropici]MBB6489241.1 hypothetical protein [Rhizobium lusitanum]MBB6495497.1 hypothetical protein [Rhizobium tropici]SCB51513.1 hypothetical protein GA0061101_14027 [Rhizobium lusitanum]